MKEEIRNKHLHEKSPMAKNRKKLEDKRKNGTITLAEKIMLNNYTIEFYKDMIKVNKKDSYFAEQMIIEINKVKKENEKIKEAIEKKKKIKEKFPRIKRLRRGPKG